MPTYGDQFLGEFQSTLDSLQKLTHVDYVEQQIRDHVSKIGGKTELFLKAVAFPRKNPRHDFVSFINELSTCGIDQQEIDRFHDLRRAYNIAKHNPTTSVTLLDSIDVVRDALATARVIVARNIGLCNSRVNPNANRVFWIAAWDHYIGGDTEVHVILPGDSEHWLGPPTFDIVYVNLSEWDVVKSELSDAGVLKDGKGLIPETQYETFRTDSDFLQAIVFEGDYRRLITVLAQHEKRQELIPGLNRHDTGHSMILAYLLAAVDVLGAVSSVDDLKEAITSRARDVYAVPDDYQHSDVLADGFVELFRQLDEKEWQNITGPIWLSEDRYTRRCEKCTAKHAKYDIAIDSDHVVVALWKT